MCPPSPQPSRNARAAFLISQSETTRLAGPHRYRRRRGPGWQRPSNQPDAFPDVNRRACGGRGRVRGRDKARFHGCPRRLGRSHEEHGELVLPRQLATRRPLPTRLNPSQSTALAITADGDGAALVRRGRTVKSAGVCTVATAAAIVRRECLFSRGTTTRRQIPGRRLDSAKALAPYQVRRGQSDDQANGNESDHAMDPRITEEPRLDFLPAVRL